MTFVHDTADLTVPRPGDLGYQKELAGFQPGSAGAPPWSSPHGPPQT